MCSKGFGNIFWYFLWILLCICYLFSYLPLGPLLFLFLILLGAVSPPYILLSQGLFLGRTSIGFDLQFFFLFLRHLLLQCWFSPPLVLCHHYFLWFGRLLWRFWWLFIWWGFFSAFSANRFRFFFLSLHCSLLDPSLLFHLLWLLLFLRWLFYLGLDLCFSSLLFYLFNSKLKLVLIKLYSLRHFPSPLAFSWDHFNIEYSLSKLIIKKKYITAYLLQGLQLAYLYGKRPCHQSFVTP